MEIEKHVWELDEVIDYHGGFPKPIHLVMPHYNGKNDVIRAYISIMERTAYPFILTIIDDGSAKNDAGYIFLRNLTNEKRPNLLNVIYNKKNRGVTPNLNMGFNLYPELDCVRLDADIEIQSGGWLSKLVLFAKQNEKAGVIAPICLNPDFVTINTAGQRIVISPEDNLRLPHFPYEVFELKGINRFCLDGKPLEVDSCLGCCAYYKREVIDKVGGIDEGYFGWVEDNDFCIGARSHGYKCFVLPNISFAHHEHALKRGYEERRKIIEQSEKRFIDKWGFSLYEPAPYWDEIVKRYASTEIMWRYNNENTRNTNRNEKA